MTVNEIVNTEYDEYYSSYINMLQNETELQIGFVDGKKNVIEFFASIPLDKLDYRYAQEKWSIKEILQHLIDTERVFMHRCFRIARNDKIALTGFDQDIYIKMSNASSKSIEDLIEEYRTVRDSFISLLGSLMHENLMCIGNANGSDLSARAAAFIVLGHEIWHMKVIKERYL